MCKIPFPTDDDFMQKVIEGIYEDVDSDEDEGTEFESFDDDSDDF